MISNADMHGLLTRVSFADEVVGATGSEVMGSAARDAAPYPQAKLVGTLQLSTDWHHVLLFSLYGKFGFICLIDEPGSGRTGAKSV
ncbi:hypothetical protein EN828_29960 [Mesorhizobium sp. M2D.F.Ca.ET.185.01.1.1]|uniref:hypothetical protein n=2 Tax=Mesorhizobium TaxID=68287 RepID=UPI000FCBB58E|nr:MULTISPECIES: hypothetical protein [unclassified Mesorhizobium]TGP73357.1 hypothetical protein EN870_29610 [bacterium M00.F.Ca.ET.227.01.1.1]TGP84369.1 hypothetical protein EN864_30355 [bacterium M00.F.Ca.ET.221.01.1.1]TGP86983.1 hypothetical protein EN865_29720 [bacterium M00.F.Ca.ET.222.01.1.1]TGT96312.1 hypothetical protein EN806_52390 [bacterium M00.F.Ca.ET.163.01.1.1]TGU22524.1 hypothetical protein EN799_51965 [bacterium M00.F.Ca.ET.156.01.1.1]TGU43142.1 hypothetical protein EN789_290